MTLSNLIQTLEKSPAFKDFKKSAEGKSAFLCAAFIIFNLKQNSFENSLDFRNEKDIFTFKMPSDEKTKEGKEEIIMQKEELLPSRKQLEKMDEKLLAKIKVEPENLQEIIEKQLKEKKILGNLEEIIAVLQSADGKLAWNLTCIVSGFVILSAQIEALSGNMTKFDKKNLLDFVSVKKPGEKRGSK